jgi:hypothetical protein
MNRSLLVHTVACASSLVLGLAISGCSKSSEAAPSKDRPAPASPAQAAKVATDVYTAEIKKTGDYKKDTEGTVEVTVTVLSGEFHINDQYPHKFTPKDADGVTFKGPAMKDRADQKTLVIKVPFTPTKTGPVTVGGKLAISVCSDKNCLMEKQDLELALNVN